jgi:hypothetical protein
VRGFAFADVWNERVDVSDDVFGKGLLYFMRELRTHSSCYMPINEFTCQCVATSNMICELNDLDWYISVGSAVFTLGATFAATLMCGRDDTADRMAAYETRLKELKNMVEHNHEHYEREVLVILKEALLHTSRSSSVYDNNSIPGGE